MNDKKTNLDSHQEMTYSVQTSNALTPGPEQQGIIFAAIVMLIMVAIVVVIIRKRK